MVRDDRLTKSLRSVLSDDLRSVIGAEVSEVRHSRRDGVLEVVAVVLTPQTIEPALVTAVEQNLRQQVGQSAHVPRRGTAQCAGAAGAVRAHTRVLEDAAPEAELVSVRVPSPEQGEFAATIASVRPLDARLIRALQAGLSDALGRPAALTVRTIALRSTRAAITPAQRASARVPAQRAALTK